MLRRGRVKSLPPPSGLPRLLYRRTQPKQQQQPPTALSASSSSSSLREKTANEVGLSCRNGGWTSLAFRGACGFAFRYIPDALQIAQPGERAVMRLVTHSTGDLDRSLASLPSCSFLSAPKLENETSVSPPRAARAAPAAARGVPARGALARLAADLVVRPAPPRARPLEHLHPVLGHGVPPLRAREGRPLLQEEELRPRTDAPAAVAGVVPAPAPPEHGVDDAVPRQVRRAGRRVPPPAVLAAPGPHRRVPAVQGSTPPKLSEPPAPHMASLILARALEALEAGHPARTGRGRWGVRSGRGIAGALLPRGSRSHASGSTGPSRPRHIRNATGYSLSIGTRERRWSAY
ncbi:hypothetical protein THAOC_22030 [Thalassiosira oceanica]|uniref:Uncharacterized protein n=1 Tax=Thalassiosira oceanica TaxID=159749 RepID=K0SH72_THAOC|nr:hypothetical protein THAOC_22030 [Thalassiosira oceanica]|eukprot:EJK57887.1 hypothetical protein THAOC_22030 [Thalassiosira oceanica]